MYCYAVNGRCPSPAHLWLTGYGGEMGTQLQRIPGFDKWMIEKETISYIEALQDQKENLVYLTADAETELEELDPKKIYIVGGLVDRNRWKGITMKKANDQGIQSARLPIGSYLKMSSSQVCLFLCILYFEKDEYEVYLNHTEQNLYILFYFPANYCFQFCPEHDFYHIYHPCL